MGLSCPVGGDSCVSPSNSSVAVFFGPVALGVVNFSIFDINSFWGKKSILETYIPSGSSVVSLSNIMIPFPVTTHEQYFVLRETTTTTVETPHVVLEFLPLGRRCINLTISRVSAIDQSKVGSGLSPDLVQ